MKNSNAIFVLGQKSGTSAVTPQLFGVIIPSNKRGY
jgi:hypothetical protein